MIYTLEQYRAAGCFREAAPLEISPELYDELHRDAISDTLPASEIRRALDLYGIPARYGFQRAAGFGDAVASFAADAAGAGRRCFYIGLEYPPPDINGVFYAFDYGFRGVVPASAYADESDAIRHAQEQRQTLTRMEIRHGEKIGSAILYDPPARRA